MQLYAKGDTTVCDVSTPKNTNFQFTNIITHQHQKQSVNISAHPHNGNRKPTTKNGIEKMRTGLSALQPNPLKQHEINYIKYHH